MNWHDVFAIYGNPRYVARVALSLALGAAGGGVFSALGLPAPWLSGAGIAAAVGGIAGLPVEVPNILRTLSLIVLGAIAGSAVTPQSVATMIHWPISIVGLFICVWTIMTAVSRYLEWVHGYNRATARLSAIPGAMPYVFALAEESPDADLRRIAIIQVMRLTLLLAILPTVLTHIGLDAAPRPRMPTDIHVPDLSLILAAATLAGLAMAWLRVPAAWLFGPMVGAALVTGPGFAQNGLPDWLTVPALVVIGLMIGVNFKTIDRSLLRDTVLASVGSVLVGTLVGVACAIPVASVLGLPLPQVWLAYAPGGVETMSVMALALGLDVAYVGGHHVVRMAGLGLVVPFWLGDVLGPKPAGEGGGHAKG